MNAWVTVTEMNEWPIFYHSLATAATQTFAKFKIVLCKVCVFLLRPHINDWISMMRWYFFFGSAYVHNSIEGISSTVSIICSMSILGNATYSESTDWNYSSRSSTKRAERLKAENFFASNENRVHLFTHAIPLDFHSRSPFSFLSSSSSCFQNVIEPRFFKNGWSQKSAL